MLGLGSEDTGTPRGTATPVAGCLAAAAPAPAAFLDLGFAFCTHEGPHPRTCDSEGRMLLVYLPSHNALLPGGCVQCTILHAAS